MIDSSELYDDVPTLKATIASMFETHAKLMADRDALAAELDAVLARAERAERLLAYLDPHWATRNPPESPARNRLAVVQAEPPTKVSAAAVGWRHALEPEHAESSDTTTAPC